MNKLSKEKRNHLILVVLVTVVVLSALWFGLINFQRQHIQRLHDKKMDAQTRLDRFEQTVKNADRVEAELKDTTAKLAALEDEMAPSDPNAWMFSKIQIFKVPYEKVEIPQLSPPEGSREMNLLAKFPYKQATFAIGGTAYFHDLGRFIADFENHFPYFRVDNIDVQPMPAPPDKEGEKLVFKMDIITLIKPGAF